MKQQAVKKARQVQAVEHGVNLDVLGRALIAQADERIKWHKQTAAVMAAELKAMTPAAPDTGDEWKQRLRRTDLESKIGGHLEYARFLSFVRQNIVRTRRYRRPDGYVAARDHTKRLLLLKHDNLELRRAAPE